MLYVELRLSFSRSITNEIVSNLTAVNYINITKFVLSNHLSNLSKYLFLYHTSWTIDRIQSQIKGFPSLLNNKISNIIHYTFLPCSCKVEYLSPKTGLLVKAIWYTSENCRLKTLKPWLRRTWVPIAFDGEMLERWMFRLKLHSHHFARTCKLGPVHSGKRESLILFRFSIFLIIL